jgi:hypothetical protein
MKKILTTTFIQLLITKTIKNKKKIYSEKIMKKEEKKNLTLM